MFEDDRLETQVRGDDGHGHGALAAEPLAEAPLDAANQSLADALRASFRVLKLIMVGVLICYLGSGFFMVDQSQVAVQLRFGDTTPASPCRPGAHWGLPYPIDEVIRVSTAPKTIKVNDFWLNIADADKSKNLTDLSARGSGLDPATDGALLTSDKAIMHVQFEVKYHVPEQEANQFVQNVQDDEALVRSVVKQAAVAEAAQTKAELVLRHAKDLAERIRTRSQDELKALRSGIQIDSLMAPKSHYPLQTTAEFLAVDTASNRKTALINEAQTERQKKLNGAAGVAWQKINAEIEKLDQVRNNEAERNNIIERIRKLLVAEETTGEAGGKIKLARRNRENIVNDTLAEKSQFEALLEPYRRNPELVRMRLSQVMREDVFDNKGVSKWVLPPNEKQITLWLGVDPKELAQREKERMDEIAKKKKP